MEKINNLSRLCSVEKKLVARDGTTKFLLKLTDGEYVETVLLLQDYGNTVCLSSQVGCKMGCKFCASGRDPHDPTKISFVRNLTAHEMLAQVLVAKKNCPPNTKLTHAVIMGMGEPFDNFDNVVEFLKTVDIGARKISVSTCGLPDKIKKFADLGLQVNLCISLHAPNDTVRQKIMPIARTHSIDTVLKSAKYFFDQTHRRVIFEYSLIDGINCAPEHALELVKRLKGSGMSYHVNLINLNSTDCTLKSPPKQIAMQFMDTLIKNGVSCTMRKGKGSDINGACGQLRVASQQQKPPALSISLDPAFKNGTYREYLAEVNTWAQKFPNQISIHLDVMRTTNTYCDNDRVTDAERAYVEKNAKCPVDVHIVTRDQIQKIGEAIVIMGIRAGESGRPFDPATLDVIKRVRAENPNAHIIVDGGINTENARSIIDAGANTIVVGSAIYNAVARNDREGVTYNNASPKAREQMVATLLGILRKQS